MTKQVIATNGIMGLFIVMMLPAGIFGLNQSEADDSGFYGMATIIQYDTDRTPVFTSQIHNQIVNEGETFLLNATMHTIGEQSNDNSIGTICVVATIDNTFSVTDNTTAFAADTANTIDDYNNCIQDDEVDITTNPGIGTIGPLTFEAGTNMPSDANITGLLICQNSADGNPYVDCVTHGILFSGVDTNNIILGNGDTVDIKYDLNISDPDT